MSKQVDDIWTFLSEAHKRSLVSLEELKANPTRGMDILIAEQVMGWPRRDDDDGKDYPETYFSGFDDGGQIIVFRSGSQKAAERWSPMQDIHAAMEVVERMIEQKWTVRLFNSLWTSGNRLWTAEFYYNDSDSSKSDVLLPIAICLASLQATARRQFRETTRP